MSKGNTYNNYSRRTTGNTRLVRQKSPKCTVAQRNRKPHRPAMTPSFPANNYHPR